MLLDFFGRSARNRHVKGAWHIHKDTRTLRHEMEGSVLLGNSIPRGTSLGPWVAIFRLSVGVAVIAVLLRRSGVQWMRRVCAGCLAPVQGCAKRQSVTCTRACKPSRFGPGNKVSLFCEASA